MSAFRAGAAWLLLVCLAVPYTAHASELGGIVIGNWLEVRGTMDADGVFVAKRVDLLDPQLEEVLIGTITGLPQSGELFVLGQVVQTSPRTEYSKVKANKLLNERVKIEGHYRGPKRFSARKISIRGPGRDRISGVVSDIRPSGDGYSVQIMNHQVFVPAEVELRHEKPLAKYELVSLNKALPMGKQVSEEDQFGDGLRISERIRFSTLMEVRYKGEDNYALDDRREWDNQQSTGSFRGRFVLAPSGHGISGQLEFRYAYLRIDDDLLGRYTFDTTRLGESFIFFDDPFEVDFDIQAGRLDFDDRREWIYDQNLDGVRAFWTVGGWLGELSATTTLSQGKIRDENTNNYVAYFSDTGRRFAAYAIYRDTDLPGLREKITHLGVRAFVKWPPEHESWLELARMSGSRNDTGLRGWGLDIGTTRKLTRHWYLTAGWAFGQGDDNTRDGTDGNFRQTRLQDNNGKFGGVTSFRYYGELMDPELANMHIGTLGLGYRFSRRGSIDLVGHYYRQDKAVRRILNSDINQRPNGIDPELGWEVDAIIGLRPVHAWDFELVVGWFRPGKAFRIRDDAWVTKLQLRYRY